MTDVAVLTDPPLVDKLTPRERAFIRHPLVTIDPSAAALAVGYSETTSKTYAYRMRKELDFYIQHYENQRMAKINVSQERVRQELAAIAFADETDYYDTMDTESGETIKVLKDPTRLPEHMRRAIKHIQYESITLPGGKQIQSLIGLELYSKLDALKQLAEYMGMKNTKASEDDGDSEERARIAALEPEELEAIASILEKATGRAKKAASTKRDQKAIPGETSNDQT